MTLSTTDTAVSYTTDGVTTVFAVPYGFFGADELIVYKIDGTTVTTLTRGIDYNVTGGGGATGAIATTLIAAGKTLLIQRATTKTQITDLANGDPLDADAYERALDRRAMVEQDLTAALNRAIAAPSHETAGLTKLPAAAARANMVLGFDPAGQPVMLEPESVYGATTAAVLTAGSGSIAQPVGNWVEFIYYGGGGGGGGGCGGTAGTYRNPGTGGGGVAHMRVLARIADITWPLNYTVGAGGAGGAAGSSGAGGAGGTGGNTTITGLPTAYGGIGGAGGQSGSAARAGAPGGGTGGQAGTFTGFASGRGGWPMLSVPTSALLYTCGRGGEGAGTAFSANSTGCAAEFGGGSGGSVSTNASTAICAPGGTSLFGSAGGAAGCGLTTADAKGGGAGGGGNTGVYEASAVNGGASTGSGGTAGSSGPGGAGASGSAIKGGQGGGGGDANAAGAGFAGGAGGACGGGGGGGGAGLTTGGVGGAGGDGRIYVRSW